MTERFTLVAFHAHPDDEALLTGGTLARAAAEGHRVVLVTATAGEAGLTDVTRGLGARRRRELEEAARLLGVARVVVLGYADSGSEPPAEGPGRGGFASLPPDDVARELAGILVAEDADVLTTYDRHGGYGHPDHVQVHRVGRLAAGLAGTPVVLEATVDRDLLTAVLRPLRLLARVLPLPHLPAADEIFTPRAELTHVVDVTAHLGAKRAALAAHASQTTGGPRTISLLLRLPSPLSRRVLGREWFRQVGLAAPERLVDDVFASLRSHGSEAPRRGAQSGARQARDRTPDGMTTTRTPATGAHR